MANKLAHSGESHPAFSPLFGWAEKPPSGRAACQRETNPRGADTTHSPILCPARSLHYVPNPLLSNLPKRGVSRVTRELPNLSKPELRDGWPVNGSRLMSQTACLFGTCALSQATRQTRFSYSLLRSTQRPQGLMATVGSLFGLGRLGCWSLHLGRAACRSRTTHRANLNLPFISYSHYL